MRIIAGQWRSRRLLRPDAVTTRPMPDRVKEAIFNILGTRYGCPGSMPPLRVADLFAGSGSLGLEALSRGAATCCFVERERAALVSLKRNLEALQAGSSAIIVAHDAWVYGVTENEQEPFDLIFLDPPYRDSEDVSETGKVGYFLSGLARHEQHDALIVLHHPSNDQFSDRISDCWRVEDARTLGTNSITLFAR